MENGKWKMGYNNYILPAYQASLAFSIVYECGGKR
jgi:hypothetical protein